MKQIKQQENENEQVMICFLFTFRLAGESGVIFLTRQIITSHTPKSYVSFLHVRCVVCGTFQPLFMDSSANTQVWSPTEIWFSQHIQLL